MSQMIQTTCSGDLRVADEVTARVLSSRSTVFVKVDIHRRASPNGLIRTHAGGPCSKVVVFGSWLDCSLQTYRWAQHST